MMTVVEERYRIKIIIDNVIEKLSELVKTEVSAQLKEVIKKDVDNFNEIQSQQEALENWIFEYEQVVNSWMFQVSLYKEELIKAVIGGFESELKDIREKANEKRAQK